MKIRDIRAVRLQLPSVTPESQPRRPSWAQEAEVANPMFRYPKYKRNTNATEACGCLSGERLGARSQRKMELGAWG